MGSRWPRKRDISYLCCFVLLVSGCTVVDGFKSSIDRWSFSIAGGTVFSDPYKVTSKQLHLDSGELFGKDVILEGEIQLVGDEHSHLVMGDGEGRMLVVLTELSDAYRTLQDSHVTNLRVLGRLERGKKGLPYILARAIRVGDPVAAIKAGEASGMLNGNSTTQ